MSAPPTPVHLWIRSESRATERRAPIVPADAAQLVDQGVPITVEESAQRIFRTSEYAEAGCTIAPEGAWVDAPPDAYIVGIKELPNEPAALRHAHLYFAHAYKGQAGAAEVLGRFARGGGELLDVEYLTVDGRRVVAFGYWAGYVGASLSLLQHAGGLIAPLQPTSRAQLDAAVKRTAGSPGKALVIGARGRSGVGACDALRAAGWGVTRWGLADTRVLDHEAIRGHDVLVNCIVTHRPQEPFVTCADIDVADRRLRVIADVTCDVTSEHNVIAINTAITTWSDPVRRFVPSVSEANTSTEDPATSSSASDGPPQKRPVEVIAIDNLPSLLPWEASVSFSADLVPWIPDLAGRSGPFAAARGAFERAAY
ncbi:MAG: saccharopine dehydrogenase [Ornithinimicrobium sp.]